jgi:hypothetical protein
MLPNEPDRKIRYRLPNRRLYTTAQQQADSIGCIIFIVIGFPLIAGIALMPFWDQIGDWRIVAAVNDLLAPTIRKLPDVGQYARTRRRELIGTAVLLYGIFIAQVLFLLASKKLRFLCLEFYDLRKKGAFLCVGLGWGCLTLCWYVVFVDERSAHGSAFGRLLGVLPFLVLITAQITTLTALGIFRDALHFFRRVTAK